MNQAQIAEWPGSGTETFTSETTGETPYYASVSVFWQLGVDDTPGAASIALLYDADDTLSGIVPQELELREWPNLLENGWSMAYGVLTNAMAPNGLPDQVTSELNAPLQSTNPPDGVSRDAPPPS